jgi:hypothetical protein
MFLWVWCFVEKIRKKVEKINVLYVFYLFFSRKNVPGFYQKIKIIPGQTPNCQPE